MAKYIDADTVVSMPFLDDSYGIEKHTVETDTIENLLDRFTKDGCPEEADVIPRDSSVRIVRCKYCIHRDPEDKKCDCGHDIVWQLPRDDNWFCADGEKRKK